jgi:hypothetical protein
MTGDMTSLERGRLALIHYPRFEELHREIQFCQRMSKIAGEPQCMSLEGPSGAGKSTLVKAYAASFPATETPQGRHIPVLCLEVPSPVGIRDFASVALSHLGDPAYEKGTRASMTMRLIGLIQDCGIELVILDEFHHLIDKKTNHILHEVSDWLKYIIKQSGVPFLVVGIEGNVEIILRANPQLSRLFATRETLQPFAWDPARPETMQDLARFVDYATDKAMGKPLTGELPRTDLLYRIHYATDGVVGNVMNLLRVAAELAEMRGADAIDLSVLSQAYTRRLQKHMNGRPNPFSAAGGLSALPLPPPAGRKQPGKRKQALSAQETLKAK